MFCHSGNTIGIVVTKNIRLDEKLHEIWSIDYQQNH